MGGITYPKGHPKNKGKSKDKKDGGSGFFGKAVHAVKHEVGREAKIVSKGATDIAKSAKRDVYGFPTGALEIGKAEAALIGGDPRPTARLLKGIGKTSYSQARHPVREYHKDPFGELMFALGVASLGGGSVARLAAGAKAAKAGESAIKATAKKPVYTRHIDLRKAPLEIETKSSTGAPLKIKVKKLPVDASPNPLVRAAGAGYRAARNRGPGATKYQTKIRNKQAWLRHLEKQRAEAPTARHVSTAPGWLTAPMDVVRGSMYLRPRTGIQNAIQAGTMALVDQGPLGLIRSAKAASGMKKLRPDIHKRIKQQTGGTATQSLVEGGTGRGRVGNVIDKLAAVQNWPEAKIRPMAAYAQGRKRGVTTPGEWENLFANPESSDFNRLFGGAEEAQGAFARLSPKEREFMRTQIPIFYPMWKALTRYGAKFPAEHSIQSAVNANIGGLGAQIQNEQIGPRPQWAQSVIPFHNKLLTPSSVYNFGPVADIASQLADVNRPGGPRPGVNLLQELGPLGEIIYGASTGKDISSGYPLRGMSRKDNDLNSRRAWLAVLKDQWQQSAPGQLQNVLQGGPGSQTRTFQPATFPEWLALQGIGPAAIPRRYKKAELHKQAKKERDFGKGRKRGRRPTTGSFSGFDGGFSGGFSGGFGG